MRIRDLVLTLLPRYAAQGKPYLTVAFGCTGGRHRSVHTAEAIAGALREAGFSPTVIHRNLGSRCRRPTRRVTAGMTIPQPATARDRGVRAPTGRSASTHLT